MKPDTQRRAEILAALDSRFGAVGFERRKDDLSWNREPSRDVTLHVHLNFGLHRDGVSVTLSFGVGSRQVECALFALGVKNTEKGATVAWRLSDLVDVQYTSPLTASAAVVADAIWADWCSVGRQFLGLVTSLEAVCRQLESTNPSDWGTHRSHHSRLLPLTYRLLGREADARRILPALGADLVGRDQSLPPFDEYVRRFVASNPVPAT